MSDVLRHQAFLQAVKAYIKKKNRNPDKYRLRDNLRLLTVPIEIQVSESFGIGVRGGMILQNQES